MCDSASAQHSSCSSELTRRVSRNKSLQCSSSTWRNPAAWWLASCGRFCNHYIYTHTSKYIIYIRHSPSPEATLVWKPRSRLWGSRLKILRNKCYHEFSPSKLDFPPHSPPPNLTCFPDCVRNPDERPMSLSNFISGFFRNWSDYAMIILLSSLF